MTPEDGRARLRVMGMLEHPEMKDAGGASRTEVLLPALEHLIEQSVAAAFDVAIPHRRRYAVLHE